MTSTAEDISFDRAYVKRFGFYGFLKLAWPQILPGTPFTDGWHVQQICNHAQAVSTHTTTGVPHIRNLVVNVPPGSTKSISIAVCWPAFVWGPDKQPSKKWMFYCFDHGLSIQNARKCRELIESDWFQARWPLQLIDKAEGLYRNEHHGWRYSDSVRGKGTGRHADIIVVDDPMKPAGAQDAQGIKRTELEFVKNWWEGTMSTRNANPKTTARVILMQRLHEEDLSGVALKQGTYTHLRLPMRFNAAKPCKTMFGGDQRTVDGELMCPSRFGEAEVHDMEAQLNVYAAAQLQQEPTSATGMVFKRAWMRFYDELPRDLDEWACSWDMTFKDSQGSDFVCGQVWARKGADFYLVERVYERLNFPNTLTAFQAQLRRFPQIGPKLIEDKANGPAVIATLERKIPGLVAVTPEGGKLARANGVSYLHRAGNVHYPRSFENDDDKDSHLKCMLGFPLASHDDSVDAETQMLTYWAAQHNALIETLERLRREQL